MTLSKQKDDSAFTVPSRFHRSANIVNDFSDPDALEGYILTPTAKGLATRILRERMVEHGNKAWSVMGPYGTGKSSFALFLEKYVSGRFNEQSVISGLREELDDSTKLLPIPLVGRRRDLAPAIHEAFKEASSNLGAEWGGPDESDLEGSIEWLINESISRDFDGVLLIADEFGKFLEHAALSTDSDLYEMQLLAELAQRSDGKFVIINLLHMAYTDYLSGLDRKQRSEWQKVQGRFADVSFKEPNEQFLKLIASAITPEESHMAMAKSMQESVSEWIDDEEFDEIKSRMDIETLLPDCVPLHPASALMAWPIFRSSLAQNERSLFTFLTSDEPYGFREIIAGMKKNNPVWFGLHHFYDYIEENFGISSFSGADARRWQEVENGLSRLLADAPPFAPQVIKCIGLLNIFGRKVGLRASERMLEALFLEVDAVRQAISYLKEKSIIIFRGHQGSYALWEGSDLDLETEYQKSSGEVSPTILSRDLTPIVNLRPVIARRHYIESGAMRIFPTEIIDGQDFLSCDPQSEIALEEPGRILYVLCDDEQMSAVIKHAKKVSKSRGKNAKQVIISVCNSVTNGLYPVHEQRIWKWMINNLSTLNSDQIAKREIQSRIDFLSNRISQFFGPILGAEGFALDVNLSSWFIGGGECEINSSHELQKHLSSICNKVFSKSPMLHNELVNRHEPSSSASRAIRNIIQAMIHHGEHPRLNIEGYPPEITILEGLLRPSGIHTESKNGGVFSTPKGDWKEPWNGMIEFLRAEGRMKLSTLYDFLRSPPYGLKTGVLPVLVCAMHCVLEEELAFYELEGKGALYKPDPDIEMFERMYKRPELFEIQLYHLPQSYSNALKELHVAITNSRDTEKPRLLDVVKPLVILVHQFKTHVKKTRLLEPPTVVPVRDAILATKDPFDLTFIELPGILGINLEENPDSVSNYVQLLKQCISSLRQAYPALLNRIEHEVASEFRLTGDSNQMLKQLENIGSDLLNLSSDSIISQLSREISNLRGRDWREVIGRIVNKGIPSSDWTDTHTSDFSIRLKSVSVNLRHHLEIAAARGKSSSGMVASFGLLEANEIKTYREIVRVSNSEETDVNTYRESLDAVLPESLDDDERRKWIAAFTKVFQSRLLKGGEESD